MKHEYSGGHASLLNIQGICGIHSSNFLEIFTKVEESVKGKVIPVLN
jgi:hypothetical protein